MALNAPIFSWCPSYEPVQTKQTRIIEARFGDGYSQRSRDGLNSVSRVWKLQWITEEAIADAIDDFLSERANVEPFYFIDPTGRFSGVYTCETWNKSQIGPFDYNVTAEFVESFEVVNKLQPQIDLFGDISTLHAALQALENAVNS